MTSEKLASLRERIADVDRSLLELLRRRMDLAAEIGQVKDDSGQPIVVPEVYDRVLRRARDHAEQCGVSEEVLESIFRAVVRGSVERQHRVGLERRAARGGRLLVLGGAGSMGLWFTRFSRLLGHPVDAVDPAFTPLPEAPGRFASLADVDDLDDYEAILVSAPLERMPEVLDELLDLRPRALVIEIASIKNHLQPALERARQAGLQVASLHPMFGPGKSPYEPLTFVLACREDPRQERERIDAWLRHPYTRLVPVPFDHHDRLMGWLLGLAHLSGMLFGCALTHSGLDAEELASCASTTYNRQSETARSVIEHDPDLYFEIQSLNPYRQEIYESTRRALNELVEAVERGDREGFRRVLSEARRYLGPVA